MKQAKQFPTWYGGRHNQNLTESAARLVRGNTYKDVSTILVMPTRGMIPVKVCNALWSLITPMNQKFTRMVIEGEEVGKAYNDAVETILGNAELSKWKYMLTVEEDNLPPPDGLLKLYESIEKYDAVGGLYWTKYEGGQPMIYGSPKQMPKDFRPQIPVPDSIQECNGLGMGFTLFRISMFKEMKKSGVTTFFKTLQEYQHGQGARVMTQDLFFFEAAGKQGYRFACDTRVKVGHLDVNSGEIW